MSCGVFSSQATNSSPFALAVFLVELGRTECLEMNARQDGFKIRTSAVSAFHGIGKNEMTAGLEYSGDLRR